MPEIVRSKVLAVSSLCLLLLFGGAQLETLLQGNWSHNKNEYCDFSCRVQEMGLLNEVDWVGENLYKGPTCDIRHAIKLWELSESHNKILNSEYDRGVILIYEENGTCYITFDVGNKK